jgi:hypothetical protein
MGIIGVNVTDNANALWGKMQSFVVFQQVVHVVNARL